ncbi:glycosyltransferase family 4 protein [Campylobacter sputorum]|uniref:glycosyltransferase family 4 protein n=1 Tax=Campylobacter sputorum TaxID=206 RepID=UPI001E4CF7AD|nr:glycosyltransferase family 4 protein [Campylobacter sputorum]
MKIIYIIDKPNMYGSEQHLLDLIKYFSQFYNVSLIAFSKGEMLNSLPAIKTKIFTIKWLRSVLEFIKLYKFIRNEKPDLIHCHQPKALFYGSIIGKILGIKTLITIHSRAYDHALIHKNLFKKLIVFIFHSCVDFVSKILANKIIFVSNKMYLQSIFKYKSHYISNWLKSDFKYKLNDKEFNIKENINFLTVGSVSKAKGFDLLMKFFNILKQNDVKFTSKIYGDIQKKFIKSIVIPSEVKLCGFKKDIKSEYENADIFILFSRSETFGLSYLEAMSQGLPIVCLDLDNLKELIPDENIKVKKITDNIINLLKEIIKKDNYKKISKINMNKSKEYSYGKKMKQTKRIYEEMRNKCQK